jgi:hypothetical protein
MPVWFWPTWLYGGVAAAPFAAWYAQRGWFELNKLSGQDYAVPFGKHWLLCGCLLAGLIAFCFGGLVVPIILVALHVWAIRPEIARLKGQKANRD